MIWLLKLPESAKFLLSQQEHDKALKVVQWMLLKNKGEKSGIIIEKLQPESNEIAVKNEKGM